MSLYIGKDDTGETILHATRGNVSKDLMTSNTPINQTTYHSKGNYLEVEYHIPEIIDGNWIKFSTNTMYRMLGYANGSWFKRPYLIIVNGKIAVSSVFNMWYPTKNGSPAYGVCGYSYNYPWVYVDENAVSAYILILNFNLETGYMLDKPFASSCKISKNGITLSGRTDLDQVIRLGNPINSVDPIFIDNSSTEIQVINSYDYYTEQASKWPILIGSDENGAYISINGKIILSPTSDMWKIPDGSVYTYFIPHSTCVTDGGWDYCLSTHSWSSCLNQSYTITTIPSNIRSVVITFTYQIFVRAGTSSWQYNFYMYNTFLISRGGTPVEIMYAAIDPVAGPSGSMKLFLELNNNGVLRWFNLPYGSSLGGFTIDFYRATFKIIPVDFD